MTDTRLQRRTGDITPDVAVRASGQVRWYSLEKGYGFIAPDAGGEDLFVRYSSIEPVDDNGFRSLTEGQRVTYEPGDDGRGPRALSVRLL